MNNWDKLTSETVQLVLKYHDMASDDDFHASPILTIAVNEALVKARSEEQERCAEIAEMWDWRESGDMTNDHIATAIRAVVKK